MCNELFILLQLLLNTSFCFLCYIYLNKYLVVQHGNVLELVFYKKQVNSLWMKEKIISELYRCVWVKTPLNVSSSRGSVANTFYSLVPSFLWQTFLSGEAVIAWHCRLSGRVLSQIPQHAAATAAGSHHPPYGQSP